MNPTIKPPQAEQLVNRIIQRLINEKVAIESIYFAIYGDNFIQDEFHLCVLNDNTLSDDTKLQLIKAALKAVQS